MEGFLGDFLEWGFWLRENFLGFWFESEYRGMKRGAKYF